MIDPSSLALLATVMAVVTAISVGGGPERFVGILIAVWLITDGLYHLLFNSMVFHTLDIAHLVFDTLVFGGLAWVTISANRIWPLFASAAQLVTISGHMAMMIGPGGMQQAYWAMTQLPAVIILLSLFGGTVAHRYRLARVGSYRQWSY